MTTYVLITRRVAVYHEDARDLKCAIESLKRDGAWEGCSSGINGSFSLKKRKVTNVRAEKKK